MITHEYFARLIMMINYAVWLERLKEKGLIEYYEINSDGALVMPKLPVEYIELDFVINKEGEII